MIRPVPEWTRPVAVAVLTAFVSACGGGGGGGGGGQSPSVSSGPLNGSWLVTTSFTPEIEGVCPADPLNGVLLDFDFCEICETDPDSCRGVCDAYIVSSPVVTAGGLGAIEFAIPPLPTFAFNVTGAFYNAGSDSTYDLSFRALADYGHVTESGWETSVECCIYTGNALVLDGDGDLVIDPEAFVGCCGTLILSGTRVGSLQAEDAEPLGPLHGAFQPRGAAPHAMVLEILAGGVGVAVQGLGEGGEPLVIELPLAGDGRFGFETIGRERSLLLSGRLDRAGGIAAGRLSFSRGTERLEGRFSLAAD